MAQPAYIIPANTYVSQPMTDVQTILNDLDTILAANGWTVAAPGGPYTTPTDTWGRWFKLTFTKATATRLQCAMTDDQARVTATREMQIAGTQMVRYYYGTRYLYIENMNQSDMLYATLLSLAPESETVHNCYCVFFGSRTSGGAADANYCGAFQSVRKDTNTYNIQGAPSSQMLMGYGCYAGNYVTNTIHVSGARRWWPAWSYGQDTAGTYGIRGRLYNNLLMYSSYSTIGTNYTVPIDDATTGTFRVINLTANTSLFYYMAVRIA